MTRTRRVLAALAIALVGVLASPAAAQYVSTPPPTVPTDVAGDRGGRTTVPTDVAGDRGGRTTVPVAPAVSARSGRLALTGTDVVQLAALAGGLVVVGVVLTRTARRPRLTA